MDSLFRLKVFADLWWMGGWVEVMVVVVVVVRAVMAVVVLVGRSRCLKRVRRGIMSYMQGVSTSSV